MSLKTRIFALAASAALMLAPAAAPAESVGYYAGELTPAVIGDSYAGGQQINVNASFAMQAPADADERTAALGRILESCALTLSFYDDFGTARVRGALTLDGVELLNVDAMIFADGSVQAMTSLTGKYVLALPAGSIQDGKLNADIFSETDYNADMTHEEFAALPAQDRLRITAEDVNVLVLQHLLGWVSYTQMNTNRLYTFDDTYLEATQARDAVSQRMVGKVYAPEFCELLWNVACTINDEEGDFQQAVADVLAEAGVTRVQMRQAIDAMFTEETIDPNTDYVETSYSVMQGDPQALCQYADVSYFFKKLVKCIDNVWEYSTDEYLDLIISYNDFGETVGVDAKLPIFSTVLPYEGDFTYSLRTDDNWQETHTAHGELQLLADNRVIGDMTLVQGQDVDGVNASSLKGTLDLANTASGESAGFGIDSSLTSTLSASGMGETLEGRADISLRGAQGSTPAVSATLSAQTETDGQGFTLTGTASVSMAQTAGLAVNVEIASAEYDEQAFAGGQAIDLTQLDEATMETLQQEIAVQAAAIMPSLLLHPTVMADVLTLMSE